MMCTAAKLLVRGLLLFWGWLFALAQLAHRLLRLQLPQDQQVNRWLIGTVLWAGC